MHDGKTLACKLLHARQHAHGVAVIERARRLVHHDRLRVLGKRAGNQNKLLLSAGDVGVHAVRQMPNADALKRLFRPLDLLAARRSEYSHVGARAHEHDVAHLVVVHRGVGLGDIGNLPRTFAHRKIAQILAVYANDSLIIAVQAQDAAKQRRLAHTIGPEHVHEHAVRNARIHVAQHLMFPVGEAHMFDIYTQILRSLVMR